MHATCTTQDIGSWWYLKSRLLCAIVKGYFPGVQRCWRSCANTAVIIRLSPPQGLTLASALC
jgi:hypothetical protein